MNIEKLSVPIAILAAGGLIAGALYYSNIQAAKELAKNPEAIETTTTTSLAQMRPISGDDHILGYPNAELFIIEYSDTECPYCKIYHTTLRQIMETYGKDGKVAWVYRHFPIEQLHKRARKEAEALECANELGGPAKFWEYTHTVYGTTNSNDSLDPKELPKIAKNIGLNEESFNQCLSSGKYAAKVQADYEDAVKIGGRGTPTSVLMAKDGTKTIIEGAQPYASLKTTIDAFFVE